MTEPSTKAREMVEAVFGAASLFERFETEEALRALEEAKSEALTYIADLERRAHPEGEVREALEAVSKEMATLYEYLDSEIGWDLRDGFLADAFQETEQRIRARLLGEEGGG